MCDWANLLFKIETLQSSVRTKFHKQLDTVHRFVQRVYVHAFMLQHIPHATALAAHLQREAGVGQLVTRHRLDLKGIFLAVVCPELEFEGIVLQWCPLRG